MKLWGQRNALEIKSRVKVILRFVSPVHSSLVPFVKLINFAAKIKVFFTHKPLWYAHKPTYRCRNICTTDGRISLLVRLVLPSLHGVNSTFLFPAQDRSRLFYKCILQPPTHCVLQGHGGQPKNPQTRFHKDFHST